MAAIKITGSIPGPKSKAFLERRMKVIGSGLSVGKTAICASHASGALITDLDGNVFIDFTGGIGAMNTGHSRSDIVDAVQAQVAKLQHTAFMVTMYESYVELAEKLVAITPGKFLKKAYFFNSGAEAVENAVKIARHVTKRQGIVAFEHAFHGRTLLTMSMTAKVKPYRFGFGPFAPEVYHAPLPYTFRRPKGVSQEDYVDHCIKALQQFFKAAVDPESVAAVVLEPVLGEGGFIIPPKRYVQELHSLCKKHGMLFIADEIQTGFARTGKMFAIEHFGIEPDMITLAKSMSAGFPLSAVVGRAEVLDGVHAGGIGGTFGGNPISCVAALASIAITEKEKLCERAEKIGAIAREELNLLAQTARGIGEVRGLGAMLAVEIVDERGEPDKERAAKITEQCGQRGLLVLSAGIDANIIRMLMPLCISDAELNEALGILRDVVRL